MSRAPASSSAVRPDSCAPTGQLCRAPPSRDDRFDMEQKAYSEYTGQGSDDDMGPRSVLPPKT